MQVEGPYGALPLPAGAAHLVLVAGGIGAAPFIALLHSLVQASAAVAAAGGPAPPRAQLPCVTFIWAAERASFFGLFAAAIAEVLAAAGEGRLRVRVSLNVTRAFPDPLVSARGTSGG